MTNWANEREDVLARFSEELSKATGDGSKKRQSGTKPPWYRDQSHEGAIFSHLTKWKRGETVDPDSGAHPLVHLAWRALAIACQESGNVPADDGQEAIEEFVGKVRDARQKYLNELADMNDEGELLPPGTLFTEKVERLQARINRLEGDSDV